MGRLPRQLTALQSFAWEEMPAYLVVLQATHTLWESCHRDWSFRAEPSLVRSHRIFALSSRRALNRHPRYYVSLLSLGASRHAEEQCGHSLWKVSKKIYIQDLE